MADVVVVDYGSGNVRSMVNALKKVAPPGQNVLLSKEPQVIAGAERVVLPGVGAFAEVRRKLDASGVLPALQQVRDAGRPVLGICVGMQVLANEGFEFETTRGLGWVPGVVKRLEVPNGTKLPHFGWSKVAANGAHPLFDGLSPGAQFYFVHSYAMSCEQAADVAATALYGGVFTAAIARNNVVGTQFHPEKSDTAGLALLANFCRWSTA